MIWNSEYETMALEDIRQLQLERLQATLTRVHRSVSFYRKVFDATGFLPEDLRGLEDLSRLPFTTKSDLRDNYPYGMFAVPLREIVRLHTSAGTGRPVAVGYTPNDIVVWSELVARVMTAAGVSRDDVVQIAMDYGSLSAAFGLHFGAEKIGASVIPMSTSDVGRQVMIMHDYRTTALVATPSMVLRIARAVEDAGRDPASFTLRTGLLACEVVSDERRREIEDRLRLTALDVYGVDEVIGSGVAGECRERQGLHLFEDHFIAEIIDPASGVNVAEGESGELVLTTITREAFPLIRYRTGDITRLWRGDCPCGRRTLKMGRVTGRSDDRIVIRGIGVFPAQVEEVLQAVMGARPRFRIIVDTEDGLDYIEVLVEVGPEFFFDEMRKQKRLLEELSRHLQEQLNVPARLKLVEHRSMEAELKTKPRVEDRRPL